MPSRRSRGDGGLYWERSRQRWIAEVTVGYTPNGKRILFSARYDGNPDLFSIAASGGDARRLLQTPASEVEVGSSSAR